MYVGKSPQDTSKVGTPLWREKRSRDCLTVHRQTLFPKPTKKRKKTRKQTNKTKKTLTSFLATSDIQGQTMRPLTEEETKTLFLKLSEYIGKNVERMINRSDERHCFRLMKDRCYYISETQMKAANNISRDNLLHVGTCIGKFTKSGKFRCRWCSDFSLPVIVSIFTSLYFLSFQQTTVHITALEYLSQYAKVGDL